MASDLHAKFQSYIGESSPCLEYPIHECSCVEMLYKTKSLSESTPNMNDKDIYRLYNTASLYYDPKYNKIPQSYEGGQSSPFEFLKQCFHVLLDSTQRQLYLNELKSNLNDCMRLKGRIDDKMCRSLFIADINQQYIINYNFNDNIINNDKNDNNNHNNIEIKEYKPLLLLFLDDSGSMSGNTLVTAKQILNSPINSLTNRIVDSNTNVYLIGSRGSSRKIIDFKKSQRIQNKNEVTSKIVNVWNANSGLTYLWEFIWENIENIELERDTSCEIVIITDGFDNESEGAFAGVTGFDELMIRFSKTSNSDQCRFYVFCVSSECEGAQSKHYRELAMGTKGTYCTPKQLQDCVNLLNLPDYYIDVIGQFEFDKHVETAIAGQQRKLPWKDPKIYGIMTQDDTKKSEL